MAEHIQVWVNGAVVELYRGMQVKHALIAHDPTLFAGCQAGDFIVEDEHGFRIGLEGAVHDGARFFVRAK